MKRNCRKTDAEREQHDRATRVRKMTDAQLCEYLDKLVQEAMHLSDQVPTREEIIEGYLREISIRTDDGLRISDATIRKLREIAVRRGYLPREEGSPG